MLLALSSPLRIARPQSCNVRILWRCGIDAVYQLEDSISDTGNLIMEDPAASIFSRLPYAETFFKNATGRCSNSLVMVGYMAMSAGIPLLWPCVKTGPSAHGVNFAVAGSTSNALPVQVLAQKRIINPATSASLTEQLEWMSSSPCLGNSCLSPPLNSLFFFLLSWKHYLDARLRNNDSRNTLDPGNRPSPRSPRLPPSRKLQLPKQLSRHRTLMNVFDQVPVVNKEAFVAPSASTSAMFRSEEALPFGMDVF